MGWQGDGVRLILVLGIVGTCPGLVPAVPGAPHTMTAPVAARLYGDVAAGRPLVAHVVVALCDNDHQGIVPVPRGIGNGQDARSNLYWGAGYGVRTHFTRNAGWRLLRATRAPADGVLERIVLTKPLVQGSRTATAIVLADAWDGRRMADALRAFLEHASGRVPQRVEADERGTVPAFAAGGAAHVVVFVGHNGLMDLPAPTVAPGTPTPPRAAIVLACASAPYFAPLLRNAGAFPLLLTTGLMAPEAYTLDAALEAWLTTASPTRTRQAAAQAYDRYQRCGPRAARRLFTGE